MQFSINLKEQRAQGHPAVSKVVPNTDKKGIYFEGTNHFLNCQFLCVLLVVSDR